MSDKIEQSPILSETDEQLLDEIWDNLTQDKLETEENSED